MRSLVLCLLATVMIALASLLTLACSSDGSETDGVDWASFEGPKGAGLRESSLEELEEAAGFELVMPSYLPEDMEKTYILSTHLDPPLWPDDQAHIVLRPLPDSGAPVIQIEERLRGRTEPDPDYGGFDEVLSIGGTDVGCRVAILPPQITPGPVTVVPGEPTPDPERYPYLDCQWVGGEVSFSVSFAWESPEPIPGEIAAERLDEASKVSTSMIENPYSP